MRHDGIWIRRSRDTLMTPLTISRQRASAACPNGQTCVAHAGKSRRNRLIGMLCTARVRVKTRDTRGSLRARARPRPNLHRCFINETAKLGRGNPCPNCRASAKTNADIEPSTKKNYDRWKILIFINWEQEKRIAARRSVTKFNNHALKSGTVRRERLQRRESSRHLARSPFLEFSILLSSARNAHTHPHPSPPHTRTHARIAALSFIYDRHTSYSFPHPLLLSLSCRCMRTIPIRDAREFVMLVSSLRKFRSTRRMFPNERKRLIETY